MGLDEGLGDGEPQAGPATGAGPVEHLEDQLALGRRHPRPAVLDHQLDHRPAHRGRHPHRLGVGGVAQRVVQEVGQHLLHEQLVDVDRGQVGRHVGDDLVRAEHAHGPLDHLGHRGDLPPQVEGARLDAGHVQEVGHQPLQGVGLVLDEPEQLVAVGCAQLGPRPPQGGHRRLDRGQGGPQVVGDGAHERVPPAVDLLEQLGPDHLLAQAAPLEGEGGLVGVDGEQLPAVGVERRPGHGHQAHRPAEGGEHDADHAGRGVAQPLGPPGRRQQALQLLVGERLARGGGHPQPVAVGQEHRRPAGVEGLLDGGDEHGRAARRGAGRR